jgi:uncharacterized protein involved in exopolysaccharide biosynthesis
MEQDKSYTEALLAQQTQNSQALGQTGSPQAATTPQGEQLELQALLAQEADLTSHYTADYPDVIAVRRKIADLRREIARNPAPSSPSVSPAAPSRYDSPAVQQLRAQIRSADLGIQAKRQEQTEIQGNIRTYQERIQSSPLVEQQYKELTRDYQTALSFYDDLLGKMNQSKMATDLEKRQEGEQFSVMDQPNLPDAPFFPKRSAFVLAGLAGGLALGLLIVALIEYKDTSIRTERDIWEFTKLPTLAVIVYSGEIATGTTPGKVDRISRLFRRKKTTLIQARG